MSLPKLTFPLTVDFASAGYWIGDAGPYKYGVAVTSFFIGDELADGIGDSLLLMRDLERYLQIFGGHLYPYAGDEGDWSKVDTEVFLYPERGAANCDVCFALRPFEGANLLVERYTFSSLRDFLYVELGKGIYKGNAPRKCRLCGNWFLHEQGDRAMYCERIAPGEKRKTCREIGARAVFEKKIQDEDTWKLYKRAYKKYYARYMKGNMSEEAFKTWAAQAARDRDAAIEQVKAALDENLKAQVIERLKEELNRQ